MLEVSTNEVDERAGRQVEPAERSRREPAHRVELPSNEVEGGVLELYAEGRILDVRREGTELKVTLEDGSAPSPAELKVVRKTGKNVGHLDPMDQIIASKTWKPGVKVEFTADELAQLNAVRGDADSAPTTTSVALTLASADAAVATFEIAMSMMMKGDQGDKGEMKIDLAGTVKVDRATGRPLEMAAGGPLAGNMGVPVTGTMTGKSTYTY